MGRHALVGLQDYLYMGEGFLAKSNSEQVENMVMIAKELDRESATSDEAREVLKLKGKTR